MSNDPTFGIATTIVNVLRELGLLGATVLFIIAHFKGYIFFKWYVVELRTRIERLEKLLDRATNAAATSTKVAASATKAKIEDESS